MSLFASSISLGLSQPNTPVAPQNERREIERKTATAACIDHPPMHAESPQLKKHKIHQKSASTKALPLPYDTGYSSWGKKLEQNANEEQLVPPTPRKKASETPPSRFQIIHNTLQTGYFKNTHVSECARGSYSAVYEIDETPNLVLKAYHGNIQTGFAQPILLKFIKNSLKNYGDIIALGLPVAELINSKTAENDGFFLQKKIPCAMDIKNPEQVQQAQKFFSLSVEKSVAMDLQPQNLRVTHENQVVLIDFIEEKDSIDIFITKACRAWADLARANGLSREAGLNLLKILTSGFLDKHEVFITAWLTEIVGE